jgi:hypothetical protein
VECAEAVPGERRGAVGVLVEPLAEAVDVADGGGVEDVGPGAVRAQRGDELGVAAVRGRPQGADAVDLGVRQLRRCLEQGGDGIGLSVRDGLEQGLDGRLVSRFDARRIGQAPRWCGGWGLPGRPRRLIGCRP